MAAVSAFRVFQGCCPNYAITYLLISVSVPSSHVLLSNCRLPRNRKLLHVVVDPGWSLLANWHPKRNEWLKVFLGRFVIVPSSHDLVLKWADVMGAAR